MLGEARGSSESQPPDSVFSLVLSATHGGHIGRDSHLGLWPPRVSDEGRF